MTKISQELKILGRHSLTYGVGQLMSRIISFLMIPLYTHYLEPSDYGVYQLVGISIEVIGLVLSLGIADAIYRFYYDKDADDHKLIISTACWGVTLVSLVVLAALMPFSKVSAAWLLEGSHQWYLISLALGTLWFNQLLDLVATYLRVTESSGKFLLLSLGRLVTGLSLNIIFIVGFKYGVLGIFLSSIITSALFWLLTYPVLLKKVGIRFSFKIAKKMLRFSLPVIPANLATLAVNASDRYFIRAFLSLADAGIYSLGYKLGNTVFYLIRVPFMQIWEPRRYALHRDGAQLDIYAKIATYFSGLMIFTGLGISVFVQDIIKIISPAEYWSAAIYVPPIILCYIIYAMDNHVAFGILIAKKTEYWTYVNLSMGAINLILNFILISRFGVWGAILATFISLVYKITALHLISMKFLNIPFEWMRMLGLLIIACIIYFVSILIHPSTVVPALFYDAVMVILFFPFLWIIGLIRPDEKEWLKKALKKLSDLKGFGFNQT